MSVYLQGGLVLLDSGLVAVDTGCCCGCTCCNGLTIPGCPTPSQQYYTYTATFDYSESSEGCDFSVNYVQVITRDTETCTTTQMCSGDANGTPICDNCVSGMGCVGLGSLPTPTCSGTYIDCDECGTQPDPCNGDGTSYSKSCSCLIDGTITFSRDDEIALSRPISICFGACCSGDGTCLVTREEDCSGTWHCAGVCDPNTCPQPGACCVDGVCSITLPDDCSGTFHAGVTCEPDPCGGTGACCTTGGCFDGVSESLCADNFGVWFGAGTVCTDFTGACCFGGDCTPFFCQIQCETFGGVYQGDGSSCEPNPC